MRKVETVSKRWFREPWPWLLMLGPGVVVVAGLYTAFLAIRGNDGLVADDYYKQGLAVNRVMQRDHAASNAGYVADLAIDLQANSVSVQLSNAPANVGGLQLLLSHATRSGLDQRIALLRADGNNFIGLMPALQVGKWYLVLEDSSRTWRLTGELNANPTGKHSLRLGATVPKPATNQ